MFKKTLFKNLILVLFAVAASLTLFHDHALALKESQIPNLGRAVEMVVQYRESGDWGREIDEAGNRGVALLRAAYDPDEKQAVVFDIDETTLDNYEYLSSNDFAMVQESWKTWLASGKAPAIQGIKKIYDEAVAKGVYVFFITGRGEKARTASDNNLKIAGYLKFEKLIMRDEASLDLTALDYKSRERAKLEKAGYHIILNVGDQYSDIFGGHSLHILKVPNPMYFIK